MLCRNCFLCKNCLIKSNKRTVSYDHKKAGYFHEHDNNADLISPYICPSPHLHLRNHLHRGSCSSYQTGAMLLYSGHTLLHQPSSLNSGIQQGSRLSVTHRPFFSMFMMFHSCVRPDICCTHYFSTHIL